MEVFDVNFERVHVDFFNRLLMINPDLTKRELRLCAFVKMDLSNKEIAPLLNISVRGVETGRYRIRKKLDIHEKNFKNYLDSLGSGTVDDLKKEMVGWFWKSYDAKKLNKGQKKTPIDKTGVCKQALSQNMRGVLVLCFGFKKVNIKLRFFSKI